jgi:CheY-like chemotaxis protein
VTRRVAAVVPDLFFAARIAATAEACGVTLEQVPPATALEHLADARPDLVLLDLADPRVLALARSLRADARTRALRMTGFYPHVDAATRAAAEAAGVDAVLTRAAFTHQLAALLAGE